MENLAASWGTFLKFKVRTEVRAFERVEEALMASGILNYHTDADGVPRVLLARPAKSTAYARAMNCLMRVCMSSIPFPEGSKHYTWEEKDGTGNIVKRSGDRNPCYSLKIEPVRRASTDTAVAYRINISDRRKAAGNMAHVLTCVYEAGVLNVYAGSDAEAAADFGSDLETLVRDEYAKFSSNYDDTDVRAVIDTELESLNALQMLGKTANFIARDSEDCPHNTERAEALRAFIKAVGHDAELLGIDGSARSRDALLSELTASILDQFDAFEETLRAKLDKPTGERKRGEKRRAGMHEKAVEDIEGIMALAAYHQAVLGATVDVIGNRKSELLKLAGEFLTRDFGLSKKEKAAIVPAPAEIPAAPAEVAAAADPFAGIEQ